MTGARIKQMFGRSSICTCGHPYEDRLHLILDCIDYLDLRQYCLSRMINIILINHPGIVTKEMISTRTSFAHLVLDPSWFRDDIGSIGKGLPNILSKETTDQLEGIGRTFCFQIYRRRFQTLSEVESDTDS